jgi:hypothetical protein
VISAYWRLSVAVGKYYAGLYAYESLSAAPTVSPSLARLLAESTADLRQRKLDVLEAQHRLAQAIEWDAGRLPLPASRPHAGTYDTKYDQIFVTRASRRAWELNQTLPLLYEVLKARAEALSTQHTDPLAVRRLADDLLDAAGKYNLAIAEYALLATGESLSGRDLVPLLIRVDRRNQEGPVVGSRDHAGKTSSTQGNSSMPTRRIIDSQVTRASGESPAAGTPERSILTEPRTRPRVPSTREPRVAQAPQEEQPLRRRDSLADQWKRHDPAGAR